MIYKQFLYFLTEEDGRSLTVDNGFVTSKAKPIPLPNTPMGWLDILISWERDMKLFGIVRSFSTPLEFVNEPAKILRHVYINQNIERKIFLLIKKLTLDIDDTTYRYIYRYLYRGELDLSTISGEETQVGINIMEGGVAKLLKANQGSDLSIPVDGDPDVIMVRMDGILITGVYNWVIVERTEGATGTFDMVLLTEEQKAPGIQVFSTGIGPGFSYLSIDADSTEYFIEITDAPDGGIGHFSGTINLSEPDPLFPANVGLWIFNTQDNSLVGPIDLFTGPEASIITIDKDISVRSGDRLFFALTEDHLESNISFTIKNKFPPTFIKAFKPYDMLRKLGNRIVGSSTPITSDLLTDNSNLVVTCGDAVRGLPGSVIKTKLTDFFDAYNAILNAGMGIENKTLTFERKAHYFDSSNPIPLGEAKGLKWGPAQDLLINTLKIGYPTRDIEDVNGRYEFNNSHIYLTNITRVVKALEIICPYITGAYDIELLRINFEGKTTTDNTGDNDVIILNVELDQGDQVVNVSFISELGWMLFPGGFTLLAGQVIRITGSASNDGEYTVLSIGSILIGSIAVLSGANMPLTDEVDVPVLIEFVSGALYKLRREAYTNSGDPDDFGVPSPGTIFNIPQLTPTRMVYTWGNYLRSVMWKFDNQVFRFSTTEKNGLLKTVQGGVTIQENADIPIGGLASPLFIPLYFEFDAEVPEDMVDLLEANANRCFSFIWEGIGYLGFLIKIALAPGTNKPQSFKLLAAPGQDLSKLVTI